MSKGFLQIFKEVFNPEVTRVEPDVKDAEGYTVIELEMLEDAQKLAVYALLNEGAMRKYEEILAGLYEVDSPWACFAIEHLKKLSKELPLD